MTAEPNRPAPSSVPGCDQIRLFLDALFAEKLEQEYILVWMLDGRRSAWFQSTTAAADYIHQHQHKDVYVGVALSPADHGPVLRLKIEGGERMPSSIVALWADIDVADAVHKKKNLPPTIEDGKSILFQDIPSSILIHSGGGLQAWWIFKEPWVLATEEDIRKAAALATRWNRALRARAAARGWDVDSVSDLTRILRVPSTSNCKIPGQPRPVQILEINDRRYNPGDLDDYLDMVGVERVTPRAMSVSGEKLEYSSAAEPPHQKFQALCDNEPKFKLTWDHSRKDLVDQSASASDMALANMAVQAVWSDQEIANLLIAHRRRYNEDLKLRDSYYAKTIAKARAILNRNDEPGKEVVNNETSNQLVEMPLNDVDRLYSILEECKSTGKAKRLFDVPVLLAALSDGQWNDFLADAKKAANESKTGLRIDLNDLKKARRIAEKKSRPYTVRREAKTAGVVRPAIMISDQQLWCIRSEAVAALQQGNDPPVVFRRLREIVRYRVDATGEPFLEVLSWMSMRSRLTDVASFFKEGKNGPIGTFPPRPLCEELLAFDYVRGTFPTVEAIARTPIIRLNGSICSVPGFDPDSKMIFVPPVGFVLPTIPENPTAQEVDAAKQLLLDVVVDFPFEDPADQTNFIAFCITPLVRSLVDVVPMCVFDAPVSGAGKGLLTDTASIIATGDVAAVIPPPAKREEWPKLLFSLLDAGRSFIVFDNLRGVLQSDALEAVLTKPLFQSRVLGFSQERIVPNRATWSVTGNNVAMSRDMVRRCYRVRIDPRCSQPHLRKNFRHSNLVDYCKSERANLLAALLVLIRAWYVAGKPATGGTPLGTYTAWRDLVGGILKHAGFDNFLGNQRALYREMDLESEEWETFLLQVKRQIDGQPFLMSDLVKLIHEGGLTLPREVGDVYGQTLTHEGSKPNPYFAVKLSHILRAHRGTRYGETEVYLEHAGEDRQKKTVSYKINHGSGK